jgi:hypothetical protein
MFLLTDINFILLFIIFIIRMNILTNQQLITIVNDSRPKLNKFLHLFDRRTIRLPVNSTFRKRRHSINEFKSESVKYFTCAMVS